MAIFYTHAELVEKHGGPAQSSLLGRNRHINAVTMRPDVDPGVPNVYRINRETIRDYPRARRMASEQEGELVDRYVKRGDGRYEEWARAL